MRRCVPAVLLVACLLFSAAGARADDAPYDGNWKVVVLGPGQDFSIFLIKVEPGPKIELVAASNPRLMETKITPEKSDANTLRFQAKTPNIMLHFVAHAPKDMPAPKQMLGVVGIRDNFEPVRFERTTAKEIDAKSANKTTDGSDEFKEALNTDDDKERAAALRKILKDHAGSALGFFAGSELVGALAALDGKSEQLNAVADKVLEQAGTFGPELAEATLSQLAQKLVTGKKHPALAVEFARRADKALPEAATAARKVRAAKTMLAALKLAGQKDELAAVNARLAKLDKLLDEEFLKDAVPFATPPYKRTNSTGRVVLVELFTGAQCPPCVAADVAFDAALKTYEPSDVVLLQYHMHIPGPDPLTNADTEARAKFYKFGGVPSTFVDGGKALPLGGPKERGENSFEQLQEAIAAQLDKKTAAKIKLAVNQKGDALAIQADVSGLKSTKDLSLRLALVEEIVRYPGTNGQRFHHHVVRAMPGGADGFALDKNEMVRAEVDVAELRKTLTEYLDKANKRRPFLDDERPLDLSHLAVVAFIQNDDTREIVQAQMVGVHGAK